MRAGQVNPQTWSDEEIAQFTERLREPARARASVLLYRTFLLRELLPVLRGRYRSQRLRVPTRILFGVRDMAISTRLLEGYEPYADDMDVELVPDSGLFIAEERPERVAATAREFLG